MLKSGDAVAAFADAATVDADTKEALEIILASLNDTKAQDIVVLDTQQRSGQLFDAVVICSVTSSRHAAAVAERLRINLKRSGRQVRGIEGPGESGWILIDALVAIVHVMSLEARQYYDLEALWDSSLHP